MTYKHGCARVGKVERLHNIWRGMIKRCHCPTSPAYTRYGARGITVCDEWRDDYIAFRTWAISAGYTDELTIERKDNNGPYAPSNCAAIPSGQQARNRRNNRFLEYNGESKTLAEWAEIYCIPYATLVARLNVCNWDAEKALTEPVTKAQQYITADGIFTLRELSERYGIKLQTLWYRLKHMPIERAISERECRGKWQRKKKEDIS